jgi:peptidylprolyl isomerase
MILVLVHCNICIPVSCALLQVIKGWDQGIVGGEGIPPMLAGTSTQLKFRFAGHGRVAEFDRSLSCPGGKRSLRLPPQLAYGEKGAGCRGWEPTSCVIPPNSTLLFDVEYVGTAIS